MPDEPQVVTLGMGTTAYLQLPGGWFRNNAGWVTGRDATLLVDTCATESRTRRLLDAVRATSAQPAAPHLAVLTHAHGDHANGARLVAEAGGTVLASPPAADDIAAGPHTYPDVFTCTTWGDITPAAITDTVDVPRRLDLGGHAVDILTVPGRAHTTGDLVIWAPHDGVLFTGDLLFAGVVPLALSGSVTGWLHALDWLDQFDARDLVPGHGAIENPDQTRTAMRNYLQWLLDTTAAGATPDFSGWEHAAHQRWPGWLDGERHAANLRIAHAESHAYTCDLNDALTAMRTAAGGTITLDL